MISTKAELKDWIQAESVKYESFPLEPRTYMKLLRT